MIYDILEVFQKEYEKSGDKLILDNYILKDGLYTRVNKDETLDYFIFKNNKNEETKEYCFKDLNGNINSSMYQWFKERDYYSNYLNSNKAFMDKKIHNVNYLSLFVKLESFTTIDSKKKISDDSIEKQFEALKTFSKFSKKEEKKVIGTFKDRLSRIERIEDIDNKYSTIKNNILSVVELAKENKIDNYIKIFFNENISKYKEESNYYYSIKIFNTIDESKVIKELTWGPSDSNSNLNSKKPFLFSKTKGNLLPPFMITNNNALMLKKFFDWLIFQDNKNSFPLVNSMFLNRDFKEKEKIVDFDFIPQKVNKLEKSIVVKNYLMVKQDKSYIEDEEITYLNHLEEKVHDIFYNNQLKNNYYNEVYKKLDNSFQNLIYMTRVGMVNYFKKHDDKSFYQIVEKYGTDFVTQYIKRDNLFKAGLSLNLKLSLLAHKGENIMDIKNMQEKMIKKLEDSNYENLSSEEFFYLTGQVAKYLINQSEAFEKKGDMLEPFLRSNNAKKLKKDIEVIYFKYKHKISINYVKFNNAMSLIMSYNGDEKLSYNMDSFLVGTLSENIFYMKKEEE